MKKRLSIVHLIYFSEIKPSMASVDKVSPAAIMPSIHRVLAVVRI